MKHTKYCITGLSRLTGVRETITPPCSIQAAKRALVLARYFQSEASAYEQLQLEVYGSIQQEIYFEY